MKTTDNDANMTVGKLAKKAHVQPHVVRLYAQLGLLTSKRRSLNGYRLFGPEELTRLRFIRTAGSLGFTLAEIGQIIKLSQKGHSACPMVRETLRQRLVESQQELRELSQMHDRMTTALDQWEEMPDRVPTGDDICHLIESVFADEPAHTLQPRNRGVPRSGNIPGD